MLIGAVRPLCIALAIRLASPLFFTAWRCLIFARNRTAGKLRTVKGSNIHSQPQCRHLWCLDSRGRTTWSSWCQVHCERINKDWFPFQIAFGAQPHIAFDREEVHWRRPKSSCYALKEILYPPPTHFSFPLTGSPSNDTDWSSADGVWSIRKTCSTQTSVLGRPKTPHEWRSFRKPGYARCAWCWCNNNNAGRALSPTTYIQYSL